MHVPSTPEGFVDVPMEGSKGTHAESFKGKTPHDIKHFGERCCWERLGPFIRREYSSQLSHHHTRPIDLIKSAEGHVPCAPLEGDTTRAFLLRQWQNQAGPKRP